MATCSPRHPGGDVATALLALDARVVVTGPAGPRILPLADLWTGFLTTRLAADELVTSIVVPLEAGRTAFLKFGRKAANTPSVVTVAVHATMDGETVTAARIALGAAGPYPMRMTRAETAVTGTRLDETAVTAAATAATEDCDPITDAIASDWYRRRMVGVFVRRALSELASSTGREA